MPTARKHPLFHSKNIERTKKRVKDNLDHIIVHKNRKRAFWALLIVSFFVPISGWLLYLGLQPGRPDVAWALVLFGALGLVAFTASTMAIIRTMRSPWHLALSPSHLTLRTRVYDLDVPWDRVIGIKVDGVNNRPGCVLIFDDVAAVAQGATFHGDSAPYDAVTSADQMMARMRENYDGQGYHLGLPGRILEMGADDLAELLTKARTGQLWQA